MRVAVKLTTFLTLLGVAGASSAQSTPRGALPPVQMFGPNMSVVAAQTENIQLYGRNGRLLLTTSKKDFDRLALQGLAIDAVQAGRVAFHLRNRQYWAKLSDVRLSPDINSASCGLTYMQQVFTQEGYSVVRDEYVRCLSLTPSRASVDVPFLPWPAPRPNHIKDVTRAVGLAPNFSGVAGRISARLQGEGYDNLRYFSLPGGFAVSTLVERYGDDGRFTEPRWTKSKVARKTGFLEYLRQLLYGESGNFRLFVFAVTDADMSVAPFSATQSDVDRWQAVGRPSLSSELGAQRVSKATKVWLMVYEFHPSADSKVRLLAAEDSATPLAKHLSGLGLK